MQLNMKIMQEYDQNILRSCRGHICLLQYKKNCQTNAFFSPYQRSWMRPNNRTYLQTTQKPYRHSWWKLHQTTIGSNLHEPLYCALLVWIIWQLQYENMVFNLIALPILLQILKPKNFLLVSKVSKTWNNKTATKILGHKQLILDFLERTLKCIEKSTLMVHFGFMILRNKHTKNALFLPSQRSGMRSFNDHKHLQTTKNLEMFILGPYTYR